MNSSFLWSIHQLSMHAQRVLDQCRPSTKTMRTRQTDGNRRTCKIKKLATAIGSNTNKTYKRLFKESMTGSYKYIKFRTDQK